MRTVIEFILTLILLITAGTYTSKAVYRFVKKEVVLRIQKGLPPLGRFERQLTRLDM
jgi:hypothetical protein